jgi:hypothetical protein
MKFFDRKICNKSSVKIWLKDFTNRELYFEELEPENSILLPWGIRMDWFMGTAIRDNFIEDDNVLNKGGDLKKGKEN